MLRLKIVYSLLLLLLLISCKKDFFDSVVEVEVPEHRPQLTVAAHFYDQGDVYIVDVGHSVGILDTTAVDAVNDATVELLEDDQVLFNSFKLRESLDATNNLYYTEDGINFAPEKTYTLKVNSPKYGQLSGTQTMPTRVLIENATYEEDGAVDRWGERGDEISIQFTDPLNEENYYEVTVYPELLVTTADSSFVVENYWAWTTPVDPLLEEVADKLMLSDAGLDGTTYTLQVATFFREQLGYEQTNGGWLEGAEVELTAINITLLSVSKDYYIFQKSFASYQDNQDNFFAEPSNVYENIEDGIGIFTLSTGDSFKIEF